MLVDKNDGTRVQLSNMSFQQTRQAAAIMDCIGRMIPQEGVDYDVEIIYKDGEYNPSLSMNIVAHTDKGEWWKRYIAEIERSH